jgi:hypothetical protein
LEQQDQIDLRVILVGGQRNGALELCGGFIEATIDRVGHAEIVRGA